MDSCEEVKGSIPLTAVDALEHLMPEKVFRLSSYVEWRGAESRGYQRLVAIAKCHGGSIAREAKGLDSFVVLLGRRRQPNFGNHVPDHHFPPLRCPDPFVQLRGRLIVRRLSPHCCRLELQAMPADRDELKLLQAMGAETANIHLGTPAAFSPRSGASQGTVGRRVARSRQGDGESGWE